MLRAHPGVGLALALAALMLLAALVLRRRQRRASVEIEKKMAGKRPLDDSERALLALAAPYARVNAMTDEHLAGLAVRERGRVCNVLERDWGIRGSRVNKRRLARSQLKWLLERGDRCDLELQVRVPADALPGLQRSLLAWDAARAIHVARLCFFAGYLDEAGAWSHVRAAAALVAPHFRTYADFGRAFLEGRALHVGAPEPALDAAVVALAQEASSPWQRLSFKEVVKLRAGVSVPPRSKG